MHSKNRIHFHFTYDRNTVEKDVMSKERAGAREVTRQEVECRWVFEALYRRFWISLLNTIVGNQKRKYDRKIDVSVK